MNTATLAEKPTALDMIRHYFLSFAVLKDNSRAYWGVQAVNVLDSTAYFAIDRKSVV